MVDVKIKCPSCKGAKQILGMGGMPRNCRACSGIGEVTPPVKGDVTHIDVLEKPVDIVLNHGHVELEIVASEKIEAQVTQTLPKKKEAALEKVMLPGYSNLAMTALLDEPRLDPLLWLEKYKHVGELFGVGSDGKPYEILNKVERGNLRLIYAQSQPRIARKVDMMASMDAVAQSDPSYIAFAEKEKEDSAKFEAQKAKKNIGGVK